MFNRRQFLFSAAATGFAAGRGVSIIIPDPANWAANELERSLVAAGVAVQRCMRVADAQAGNLHIVAEDAPETVSLVPGNGTLQVRGRYALLELADRVQHGLDLVPPKPVSERPANAVRSITRMFTSDVEDKPWFNDREMWPEYLNMLAANRFNRFSLALGIGYDFIRQVTDAYFLFAYPFLLDVPGYRVRVPQLPDAERDQNLKMLQFISEQTVARGMQFQLGIWMHGYEWIDSPRPNYTIEGLTRETHGAYCRDAVRMLLKACPAISGVTFRVHGESGVEEGSYDFWRAVFEGVKTCGRRVEIDMHSKGMDETMIKVGLATGLPLRISPKFWAEHMGMPYHQADIREQEQPKAGKAETGLMKFSAGSRSFTRYGYADLLREDRQWSVIHRVWSGTQRVLLWADPVTAAAYSRAFSFCGSDGVELMEPLSFKGRRGSGIAGDRCAYADASLKPRWDWQKYLYNYRVWGRLLYNPDSEPDVWLRSLTKSFGAAASPVDSALSSASRILPIVTTAHLPSAANNNYWPEVYSNHSMIDGAHPRSYSDTPAPKVFGNVSPLDPQLFSRINDFADQLLSGETSGKYSPIEVAQWIQGYAALASKRLGQAEAVIGPKDKPEWRRISEDVRIEVGLGNFFGAKFRSGVLYRIYERTGDSRALDEALKTYRAARDSWAEFANRAKAVYVADITVGELPQLRGHWIDRLPALDADIALMDKLMDKQVGRARSTGFSAERVDSAIKAALGRPVRTAPTCEHRAPENFRPGQPLAIDLSVKGAKAVRLHYRHVTQAERWQSVELQARGGRYYAAIAASYTDSPYPLQYYFEIVHAESAVLYPGLREDLTGQPYFVIRRA